MSHQIFIIAAVKPGGLKSVSLGGWKNRRASHVQTASMVIKRIFTSGWRLLSLIHSVWLDAGGDGGEGGGGGGQVSGSQTGDGGNASAPRVHTGETVPTRREEKKTPPPQASEWPESFAAFPHPAAPRPPRAARRYVWYVTCTARELEAGTAPPERPALNSRGRGGIF